LKTDPYNRTLWQEVQQDFQRLGLTTTPVSNS
jgi:hypothetical protein